MLHRCAAAILAATLFPSAFAGDVIVVRGPLGPTDALAITKHASLYGDFGYLAIAEGDAGAVSELVALGLDAIDVGPWNDGADLHVAREAFVPDGAQVLATHHGQVLFHSTAVDDHGCSCGHTIAHVRREAIAPSRGFAPPSIPTKALTVDPRVAGLVAQVSQANIQATTVQLASYFTRRADSATAVTAKNWLVAKLQTIPGITVTTQTFGGSFAPNIVATIPGTTHPEKQVVLGAHYDSINGSGASLAAPGADDNASGSAGIVECARILAQADFENTIRLLLFSAEEFGLVGSDYDSAQLAQSNADVVAMLNMDMIGHWEAGDGYDLDFATNDTNAALTQWCRDVTAAYVPGFPTKTGVLTAGTSDHASYHADGFPAAFFFEDLDQYSMVIHTANDVVGTSANAFDLARDITKACLASAALLAKPVDLAISHVPLTDTTNGSGPYAVRATVTSLIGSSVVAGELRYRVNGGAWTIKAMNPSAIANEWVASIPGVFPSGSIEYLVLATDSNGFGEYSPAGAETGADYHAFSVGNGTTIYFDDFDGASSGWTSAQVATQNDWQLGPVNGESTDPGGAYSGAGVRGNDLGSGNYNGEYQSDVENYLESPIVNCVGKSNVHLSYRRWLGVEDGAYDQATVEINSTTVWQNPATPGGGTNHLVDDEWTAVDHDVSAIAANNPSVRVRFRLESDGGLELGGWTLDDVRLYSVAAATKSPLAISDAFLSQSTGGVTQLAIDAGAAKAGRTYVIAMSVTGTAPGAAFGSTTVPLVFDAATNVGFSLLNTPAFANFAGPLSASGTATATLALPPLGTPGLAGLKLWFAAFTLAPVDYATNAVTLEFVP